jgi:hypothetical protein
MSNELRILTAAGLRHGMPNASLLNHSPHDAGDTMSESIHETNPSPAINPSLNPNDIPRELEALVEVVQKLPEEYRQMIEPALTRVVDSNRRRRRILSLVQDALSQLRLDMKYLAFDLEATRRERDDFRRKLEESA